MPIFILLLFVGMLVLIFGITVCPYTGRKPARRKITGKLPSYERIPTPLRRGGGIRLKKYMFEDKFIEELRQRKEADRQLKRVQYHKPNLRSEHLY